MRIASLPMYDVPELRRHTDALWAAIARALDARGVRGVPAELCRDRPLPSVWLDPELLLSQTCGYPLVRELAGRVQVVATPHYRVPLCQGSWYRSRVVVPRDSRAAALADLAGSVAAVNEPNSHSGMNALRAMVAPLAGGKPFFRRVLWTGAHRASLELVARGEADVACIDCVSFALFEAALPELVGRVRAIDVTAACPGLPIITAASTSADEIDAMRAALAEVAADPDLAGARDALLLDGFELLDTDVYRRVDELEADAARLGYRELA
jgi:ABC-type phosphate/phosphonate transport system substrate-binding protein